MENEIIAIDALADIENMVESRLGKMKLMALSQEQLPQLAKMVTENNALIKVEKSKLDEAREKAVKFVFGDTLEKYEKLIAELESGQKEFQANILSLKKMKFREETKKTFDILNDGGQDGEIFDFESIYDERWYGKSSKAVLEAIQGKLTAKRRRSEYKTATFVVSGSEENIERVRNLIKTVAVDVEEF